MTNDLVERLRAMPSSLNDALRTMDEAADKIEQLRKDGMALIDAKNAEIKRLRTVMQQMADEIEGRLDDRPRET